MSIVEVMTTASILLIGALGIFGVLLSSRDLTTQAETLEAASHVAEQELEAMQSLTWSAMAHAAAPASGPAPHSVSGTPASYQVRAGVLEPVVVATTGTVPSAATAWSDDRIRGTMWRYVSWVDDPCCAGTQNYKRLTVVVTVANRDGIRTPVVVSTLAVRKAGV